MGPQFSLKMSAVCYRKKIIRKVSPDKNFQNLCKMYNCNTLFLTNIIPCCWATATTQKPFVFYIAITAYLSLLLLEV